MQEAENLLIRYQNKIIKASDLRKTLKIPYHTVRSRIMQLNWPIQDAYSTQSIKTVKPWQEAGQKARTKIPRNRIHQIQELREKKVLIKQIAVKFNVTRDCINKILKEYNLTKNHANNLTRTN